MCHTRVRGFVGVVLCLVLAPVLLWAQLQLGSFTLSSTPAPELVNPPHLQLGVQSQRLLDGVDGVAFDQVATPARGIGLRSYANASSCPPNPGNSKAVLRFDSELSEMAQSLTPSVLPKKLGRLDGPSGVRLAEGARMLFRRRAPAFGVLLLSLPMLVVSVAGCDGISGFIRPATPISEIKAKPAQYMGKEVTIRGIVTDSAKIPYLIRYYGVAQNGASIVVVTNGEPPLSGQEVSVRGTVTNAAVWGGQAFVVHIKEIDRR